MALNGHASANRVLDREIVRLGAICFKHPPLELSSIEPNLWQFREGLPKRPMACSEPRRQLGATALCCMNHISPFEMVKTTPTKEVLVCPRAFGKLTSTFFFEQSVPCAATCSVVFISGWSIPGGSLATQSGTRKYRNGLAKVGKYWWVCLKRAGKKVERSTGCTSRSDAEKVRDALRTQLGLGKHGIEAKGPFDVPTLEKALSEWRQANAEVVSARYLEQMGEMVQIHMGKWKDLPLNEITTEIVEKARKQYLASKGKKTLKGTTFSVEHSKGGANRLVRLLSALYGWAIRSRKYLKERPWHLSA